MTNLLFSFESGISIVQRLPSDNTEDNEDSSDEAGGSDRRLNPCLVALGKNSMALPEIGLSYRFT